MVITLFYSGMDKVRERGALLPGNDKKNLGNRHTGKWRKREEGGRRKRRERKEKEEERKKRQKLRPLQRKRKSMVNLVMINLNQAKRMNEENWIETETTEMRKNVKKKDEEENCRIGKEEITGSEMEEKREEEWKAATREKEGNVKEYWRNHLNGIIGIWRVRE